MYLRGTESDEVHCCLIMGRLTVSKPNVTSILRLEIFAAVVVVQVMLCSELEIQDLSSFGQILQLFLAT